MTDPEIEDLRNRVHCAVVLERTAPPWKLDRKESTKLSLKYRRGKGEILIVNHGGRGWWDPTSDAKGDVFGLVQRLEPGINFGHVRKRLREFAGLAPSFPISERVGRPGTSDRSVAERWADRKAMRPGSATWCYLARKRFLPSIIIEGASRAGVLREGPAGSAWFAHVNDAGSVAHVDIRGSTYKGSLTGGAKSLFRMSLSTQCFPRVVLAEAAIDALSVAAIEGLRTDTLYVASGGGMGQGTIDALEACSPTWRRSRAHSSAAQQTPTDRAIDFQSATSLSRRSSMSHLRGSDLQTATTGMMSFALARHIMDRRHNSRHRRPRSPKPRRLKKPVSSAAPRQGRRKIFSHRSRITRLPYEDKYD